MRLLRGEGPAWYALGMTRPGRVVRTTSLTRLRGRSPFGAAKARPGRTLPRVAFSLAGAALALALAASAERMIAHWAAGLVRTGPLETKVLGIRKLERLAGAGSAAGARALLELARDRTVLPLEGAPPLPAHLIPHDTIGDLALDALRRIRTGNPEAPRVFEWGVDSGASYDEAFEAWRAEELEGAEAWWKARTRRRQGVAEVEEHRDVLEALDRVLQGMIDDITAVKDRYPELAEWNVNAPVNGGFNYQRRFEWATDPPEVGEHGCHLGAWLRPASDPPPVMRNPRYRLPNLGAFGHTWIYAGEEASEGFCAEVQAIFVKHIAVLEEAERRAAPATARQEP